MLILLSNETNCILKSLQRIAFPQILLSYASHQNNRQQDNKIVFEIRFLFVSIIYALT